MMSMRRRAEMKKKLVNPIFSTNFHCSTFPIFQKRDFNILHPPRPVLSHLRPRSFVILTNFKLTREFNFEDQCGLVFFFLSTTNLVMVKIVTMTMIVEMMMMIKLGHG